MSFLRVRNKLMIHLGWNRRVATLAARLALGSDTWKSIASTSDFLGRPLLSLTEVLHIRAQRLYIMQVASGEGQIDYSGDRGGVEGA